MVQLIGKEHDAGALERQLVVAARVPVHSAEQDFRLELDQLVGAPVGEAEHESADAPVGCDDGFRAEPDGARSDVRIAQREFPFQERAATAPSAIRS